MDNCNAHARNARLSSGLLEIGAQFCEDSSGILRRVWEAEHIKYNNSKHDWVTTSHKQLTLLLSASRVSQNTNLNRFSS